MNDVFSVTFLHLLQTTFYFSVAIMTAKNMIAKKGNCLKMAKVLVHFKDYATHRRLPVFCFHEKD